VVWSLAEIIRRLSLTGRQGGTFVFLFDIKVVVAVFIIFFLFLLGNYSCCSCCIAEG
tara:strand:+ start:321 stop:491 length:171 start_codon:yes stop_codon:yes gene_type:complete